MSPAYAASLGKAYEKIPKKKMHTHDKHIKVNFRLHIIKRIILQRLPQVIYHHFIEQPTI